MIFVKISFSALDYYELSGDNFCLTATTLMVWVMNFESIYNFYEFISMTKFWINIHPPVCVSTTIIIRHRIILILISFEPTNVMKVILSEIDFWVSLDYWSSTNRLIGCFFHAQTGVRFPLLETFLGPVEMKNEG